MEVIQSNSIGSNLISKHQHFYLVCKVGKETMWIMLFVQNKAWSMPCVRHPSHYNSNTPSLFLFVLNLQNTMKLGWRISLSFSAWISMMKPIHAILQMGFFRRSRGRYLEKFFWSRIAMERMFPIWNLSNHQRSVTCKGFRALNWTYTSTFIVQLSKGLHFQGKSDIDQGFFIGGNRWSFYVRPFKA